MSDPSDKLRVRYAVAADLPTIVEFNRRLAQETEGKELDERVLSSGVAKALADHDRLCYWVAELGDSGTVVGQAAITREWSDWRDGWLWWFQSVYVAQGNRGSGVFRAIYQHIHAEARSNPEVIGLRLYVENSNERAQHTYQSLGMKPGGYSVYEALFVERFVTRDR